MTTATLQVIPLTPAFPSHMEPSGVRKMGSPKAKKADNESRESSKSSSPGLTSCSTSSPSTAPTTVSGSPSPRSSPTGIDLSHLLGPWPTATMVLPDPVERSSARDELLLDPYPHPIDSSMVNFRASESAVAASLAFAAEMGWKKDHVASRAAMRLDAASSTDESQPPTPTYGLPANFAEVQKGVYRSSFPHECNLDDLRKLKLTTILTLVRGDYTPAHAVYLFEGDIMHHIIPLPAHKEPSDRIPAAAMASALNIVANPANHPVLIHCNKGKHRTGCLVGAWRKRCGWSMDKIIGEYQTYAGLKARTLDEDYLRSLEFNEYGVLMDRKMDVDVDDDATMDMEDPRPEFLPAVTKKVVVG